MDLGVALQRTKVSAPDGDKAKAAALFDQAVQAYRSALEVRTKANDPYHWARTMRNLSLVYKDQGNTAAAQQALAEANSVDPQ
jgi:tetratricopeptide (TPR) repeat protein